MKTKYRRFRFGGQLSYHIRFPDDFKYKVSCVLCDVVFGAKRWDCKYCSSQCRQSAYRKRKAGGAR